MPPGRPLRADVERPPCPRNHEGRTRLNGHIKSPDGRYERPQYQCVPADPVIGKHSFTATLPVRHQVANGTGPHACEACERPLKRNEGLRTAIRFRYAIRDIAEILVRLGRGELYRDVSESVRTRLDRVATRGAIAGQIGDSASPAIHALDIFAPIIIADGAPDHWPRIVAVDAMPLRARHRKKRGPKPAPWPQSAKKKRKRKPPPGRVVEIGQVLVAVGKDRPEQKWRPLLIRFEGGGDEGAWTDFLGSLSGQPEWVVSDRGTAIENGVANVWPQAIHYFSHYHLQKNARDWLAKDKNVKAKDRRTLDSSIDFAFGSLRSYTRLQQEAVAVGAANLDLWLRGTRPLHRKQLIKQIGYPGFPKSAGPTESGIETLKAAIYARRHNFTNVDRLNKLLGLIRRRMEHTDQIERYSSIIRDWLMAHDGRVNADWWEAMDSWTVRSLDLAIEEAEVRRKGIQAVRQAPAKAARYRRNLAAYDQERTALGLPPRPRGLPRPIKLHKSVAGLHVSDFPWLMAEWHPTRNAGIDPATVEAGTGKSLWWKCDAAPDHEWPAQVRSRTLRGVRCPFCTGRRVAVSDSFASTHPDIAVEWHPTRNRDKRPERFTFGSHFEAWWQCPTYKTHVYQARISSRTSMMSGCRKCSDLRRRKKKPRRLRAQRPAA